MQSLKYARLALAFDVRSLVADLAALPKSAWHQHFNTQYHDGGWSGIALRSPGGDASRLYPDPRGEEPCIDTPMRAACPAIDDALGQFGPALQSARLLRLGPGGCIREHRDYGLSLDSGEARLHVPIVSGAGVEFYLDGELLRMAPGECWYLNLDLPHRVQNLGTEDRIHLVLDCKVDDGLAALFPATQERHRQVEEMRGRAATGDCGQQRLDRLRHRLLDQPALIGELAAEHDLDRFLARVHEAGRRVGLEFTIEDVRAALASGRRGRTEQWTGS
jgi:Aspartyl/Asparaginyl beta-hydroxylase